MLKFFNDEHSEVWQELTDKQVIDDALEAKLVELIEQCKKRFVRENKTT